MQKTSLLSIQSLRLVFERERKKKRVLEKSRRRKSNKQKSQQFTIRCFKESGLIKPYHFSDGRDHALPWENPPPGSNLMWPPQLVKAIAAHLYTPKVHLSHSNVQRQHHRNLTGSPLSPPSESHPQLESTRDSLSIERKTPAFSLSESHPPRLALQPGESFPTAQ